MERYRRIRTMSAEEAREWLATRKEGDFVLLDVRQPAEYRAGHLPGAVFIPLPELLDRAGEVDSSKPVLTYCRRGNRSRSAAALLLTEGFADVISMEGGIMAWNGQVAVGGYGEGMYLLEGRSTAEELVSLAWTLEEGSRMFYEKAVTATADGEAQDLFRRLAKAEEKHKLSVEEAYGIVAGRAMEFREVETLRGVMEGGVKVEEVIGFLEKSGRTARDAVEISMEVEANALDLYIKMLRAIEDQEARKVFASLIDEEKHHLSMLGGLLERKLSS